MNIDQLEKIFLEAKEKNYNFVGVLIEMEDFKSPEVIINNHINIKDKLNYYKKTYNENLSHKYSNGIKIISAAYANNCNDVYNILHNNKTFFELLIDNEITIEDISKYILEWSNSRSELSVYEYLGLTRKQYEYFELTGKIIF